MINADIDNKQLHIPTGGVDKNNIDEFLAWDKIYAVGGSSFVKEALEEMEAKK